VAELSTEQLEYIQTHRNALLATNRKQGAPQLTLISYHFDGKDFTVSTRGATQKAKNLSRRPDASLAIVDGGRQLIVYGKATVVSDPDEVLRLHLSRMAGGGGRSETPAELAERLRREERVIIIIEPQSYFPATLRAP